MEPYHGNQPWNYTMKLTNDQLAAYLARIGYQGPVTPTLSTLQGLHLHHPRHIPFENLDSWLGITVSLDPDSVFNKLVVLNRGGYCFGSLL